jgi:DNA-binding MarR family transcriptional regulator
MAQMLARMQRDGLIERTPDPKDGRSSRIVLTHDAEARMPAAIETLFAGNGEAMQGFSEEEKQQFVDLLTRLIANLDRIAGGETASQR